MAISRPRGEQPYPSAFSQGVELTELRRELPWLNDVPRHVLVQVLGDLHTAWRRCFDKISRRPRWKRKTGTLSFTEFQHDRWHVRGNNLIFPKLGPMKIVMSRPLEGKPKSCTLKRDGDQWFAFMVCEVETPIPVPRSEPKVGIDRGITNFLADSNGNLTDNPRFLENSRQRLARAQRKVSRKVKGSKNREKAKNKVMRIHRHVRRQRDHFIHVLSTSIAKNHGTVVLENLNIEGMILGSLSRSIGDAGWGKLAQYLKYKLSWTGGTYMEVPAQYTSQTCSSCSHVDKHSRKEEKFCCTKCGFTLHADVNAAINILRRASRPVKPVEGSSVSTPRRSRKSLERSNGRLIREELGLQSK